MVNIITLTDGTLAAIVARDSDGLIWVKRINGKWVYPIRPSDIKE